MIAPGADHIVKARMRGYRPADTVVVSLIGGVALENPTVLPDPSLEYDWRWIKGLDVALFIAPGVEWRDVAMALKQADPSYLVVWDVHSNRGAEVLWRPVFPVEDAPQNLKMVAHCGWYWNLDFSPFHEEENEAYFQ